MITEGSLQDFSLPDLAQILSMGNSTGTLTLRSEGRQGQLYFQDGKLLAARLGDRWGALAGADLFIWTSGVFDFEPALPTDLKTDEPLSLEDVTREGLQELERWRKLGQELPDFFSPRAWVFPMQMYVDQKPAIVEVLGSGMTFAELVRKTNKGELQVLEEVTQLFKADQIGLSCAPEEQLRQIFHRVANELFNQFASISGVKMVDGLETQLNDQARKAHLGLRWRGGKVQDSLPDTWSKEQLVAAYRPLIATLQEFVAKIYGAAFIDRVVGPLLEEVPGPQRALWSELTSLPTPS
ncbi:MAG: hypothetical protein JWM80_2387 [Cyanobacteria bacterium RYN_339]|nr:hypothetical protein [Cyanobacteria bacterium RYN_339]